MTAQSTNPIPRNVSLPWKWIRRSLVCAAAVSMLAVVSIPSAQACQGRPPRPICSVGYVFSKSGPLTLVSGGVTTLPITTFHFLSITGPCPPPPYSVTMSATLTCVPAPSSGPTIIGPFPLGAGPSTIPILLPIPAGPPRICLLAITSTVTLPTGATLSMTADQTICIVDPSPDDPSLPRLDMTLLTPDVAVTHPGSQAVSTYRITNNDLTESWTGDFTTDSRNVGGTPTEGGTPHAPGDGTHSISDPGVGDNFPIGFLEDLDPSGCLPLPPDPLTFLPPMISKPITVPAGGFVDVDVYRRSWGMCANGSCSESTSMVDGLFADGTDGFACAGVSHVLDTAAAPSYDWPDSGAASNVFVDTGGGLVVTHRPSPTDEAWVNVIPDPATFGFAVNGFPQPIPADFFAFPLDNNYGRQQIQLQGNWAVDSFFDVSYEIDFRGALSSPRPVIDVEIVELSLTGGPTGLENESPGAMGQLAIQALDTNGVPFDSVLEITKQLSTYAHLDNGEIFQMHLVSPPIILPIPGTSRMQVQLQTTAAGAPPTASIVAIEIMDDTRGFSFTSANATPPGCAGDANGDGFVDVNDISFVLFRLGQNNGPCGPGDANGDGFNDVNDISFVLFRLGTCNPGPC